MRTALRSLCILRILSRAEKPVGESFVQSSVFLLQEALGEDLGCCFYLDQYGPRSREIIDNLIALAGEEKVIISGSPRGLVIEVTEKGKVFINRGGEWGAFFDLPPVRIPEGRIDTLFSLACRQGSPAMEAFGTALYIALSAAGSTSFLETLKSAKSSGCLAPDIDDRAIVEAYRRLRKFGARFAGT